MSLRFGSTHSFSSLRIEGSSLPLPQVKKQKQCHVSVGQGFLATREVGEWEGSELYNVAFIVHLDKGQATMHH